MRNNTRLEQTTYLSRLNHPKFCLPHWRLQSATCPVSASDCQIPATVRVRCPGPLGSCPPVRLPGVLCCCVACVVSWTTWLLFTGAPARRVALRVRCPRPLGTCLPVCPLGVLCCLCGVPGHLAPVHGCARCVVVLRGRCPGPLGSCSPVRPLGVLCCVCGVPGLLAPVHRCARSVCCFACAASWATWLLFTGVCLLLGCVVRAVSWATWLLFTSVPVRCVVLRVRCPGPLGSCSPVRRLGMLLRVCGDLGLVAPVHRCARSVCFVACAVSRATWLLFTGEPARCVTF